jgi:hypothetical protein
MATGSRSRPPSRGLDEGSPWARLTTEQVVTNVEVAAYLRATGP